MIQTERKKIFSPGRKTIEHLAVLCSPISVSDYICAFEKKRQNSRRTSKGWAHGFSCPWFIVMHTFTILKNPRDASSSTKHKITLPHTQKCLVWRTMCPNIHHRSRFCPLTSQRNRKFATGVAFSFICSIQPQQISFSVFHRRSKS